jgi:hypothetical protein
MWKIRPGFWLIVIASSPPFTACGRDVRQQTVPPCSPGEIVSIVNRPLDNVYESRYRFGFCTEDVPIIHLTTNDVRMFFTRFTKCWPLRRAWIPELEDSESNQSRGVILTKSGDCYHWHLIRQRYLYLFDSGPNYTVLVITNKWRPKVMTNMTHAMLVPPSPKQVSSFWNEPESRPRIHVRNCERGEILSFFGSSQDKPLCNSL